MIKAQNSLSLKGQIVYTLVISIGSFLIMNRMDNCVLWSIGHQLLADTFGVNGVYTQKVL